MSLKYKVLFIFIIFPTLITMTYTYFTIETYSKNQVAYVFDVNSDKTTNLSNQINFQLQNYLDALAITVRGFNVITSEITDETKYFLENTKGINGVYITSRIDGKIKILNKQLKKRGSTNIKKFENMANKSDKNKEKVTLFDLSGEKEESWMLVREKINGLDYMFFISCDWGKVKKSFQKKSNTRIFLYNSYTKKILWRNDPSFVTGDLKYFGERRVANHYEVKMIETTGGEKYLLAASPIILPHYQVISLLKKDIALSAIDNFVTQAIIFFLVIIAISILFGLLASIKLTRPLELLVGATKSVSKGNFNINLTTNSSDEIGLLSNSFNVMSRKIAVLLKEVEHKIRMETELETAKLVQQTLLPKSNTTIDNFNISGTFMAASECSGDWWYYNKVSEKIYLWIGDVTGHGVPAALMTSAVMSTSTILSTLKNMTPGRALKLLNNVLCKMSGNILYMTFFMAILDTTNKKLTYSCASHDPPLLFRKINNEYSKKGIIPLNEVNGLRLRTKRNVLYDEHTIDLEDGDVIIFFTDGILDVVNSSEKKWGERNFIRTLVSSLNNSSNIKEVNNKIKTEIDRFREESNLVDDITYFLVSADS